MDTPAPCPLCPRVCAAAAAAKNFYCGHSGCYQGRCSKHLSAQSCFSVFKHFGFDLEVQAGPCVCTCVLVYCLLGQSLGGDYQTTKGLREQPEGSHDSPSPERHQVPLSCTGDGPFPHWEDTLSRSHPPPSTAPVRCTLFPHFWNASLGAPGGMCEVTPFLGL